MSVVQKILRITPKQYHAMFGESFTAIAPLVFVCGVASTFIVAVTSNTLFTHPEVYVSQRKRGNLIHEVSDGVARTHWVHESRARNAATNMNEYHTNVFTPFNKAYLGSPRPRLDMEKVEKL